MRVETKTRIMFVCLGNICRSPAAQAVMQSLVAGQGLESRFEIDSSGTGSYHIGRGPDPRMIAAGMARKLQFASVAKAFEPRHIAERDLIVAMDHENHRDILAIAKLREANNLRMLSDYLDESWPRNVPDPYYGGRAGFDYVLDMLEAACPRILQYCLLPGNQNE